MTKRDLIAKLIGEESAGLTAVEIFDKNENLLWTHRWFDNGASHQGYMDGLFDALECMRTCADVSSFDGGAVDEDGDPDSFCYDNADVMLTFDSGAGKFTLGDGARTMGQGSEIIDALMVAGLLDADDEHEDNIDNEVVQFIANKINTGV